MGDILTAASLFGFSLVSHVGLCKWTGPKLIPKCTISAPGKVLIAGGYLVLEQPNVGIVVAATSRFYSTVEIGQIISNPQSGHLYICVISPQFYKQYDYKFDLRSLLVTAANVDQEANEFVEKCLQVTLTFISHFSEPVRELTTRLASQRAAVRITLQADNDFYSQVPELRKRRLPVSIESLRTISNLQPCTIDSQGRLVVAKTGMGSSAALTTSMVGGLLEFFCITHFRKDCDSPSESDLSLLHKLAQICHAIAQGKVGSGFDVSSAVYGSQTYTRFDKATISAVLDTYQTAEFTSTLNECVMHSTWDHAVSPFALPPGLDLVMGDVCGGSETPSMVRKVLEWKKNHSESNLWDTLGSTNASIAEKYGELMQLSRVHGLKYHSVLNKAGVLVADQWNSLLMNLACEQEKTVLSLLITLKELCKTSRNILKQMGNYAGVPIEPDEQTALCDATEAIAGVLCAGVPGAGGVDAVFAITVSAGARESVEAAWAEWSNRNNSAQVVCPLLLHAAGHGGANGARVELQF